MMTPNRFLHSDPLSLSTYNDPMWGGSPPVLGDSINVSSSELNKIVTDAVGRALNKVTPKHGREDRGTGDKVLGSMLRRARMNNEFSQEDLATYSGVHRSTIGRVETGDRGMSLETFSKLYNGLSWVPDDASFLVMTKTLSNADQFRDNALDYLGVGGIDGIVGTGDE